MELKELLALNSLRNEKIDTLINGAKDEHTKWLLIRQKGIGGSDAGIIMGDNKYKTPYELWQLKTFNTPLETAENSACKWGHILEGVVADEYAKVTKSTISEMQTINCSDMPFISANVDRIVEKGNKIKILECKTARMNISAGETDINGNELMLWGKGNVYNDDGEAVIIDNQVPISYWWQVQHYMLVTGIDEADIAVLLSTSDFRIFTVKADKEAQNALKEKICKFWECVLTEVAPPYKVADIKKIKPKEQALEIDTNTLEKFKKLKELKSKIKEMESEHTELQNEIIELIGENDTVLCNGSKICTYKQRKGRETTDLHRLELENPQINLDNYKVQGAPYRVFMFDKKF